MKKQNWLLLRGLAREVEHWGDFPKLLKQQEFSKDVLALDLPGIGTEKNRNTPLSITSNTDDLRHRWRSKLKNESPWGVIGMSLGAMIAMDWMSRYPDDFESGVFINTSARGSSNVFQRLKPHYLKHSLKALLKSDIEAREREILKITSNLKCNDQNTQKMWIRIAMRSPVRLPTILFQLVAAAKFSAPKQLSLPLLILASKADHMVDYNSSKNLSEIYKAQLRLHETAGHDLPLDDPEWILNQIKEFSARR